MKLHPLLLAPIVLCAPALAAEAPQQAPLLVNQLLANFKASPQAFQDASLRGYQWRMEQCKNWEPIAEKDSLKAFQIFVIRTAEQDIQGFQHILSADLPDLYKEYYKAAISLQKQLIDVYRKHEYFEAFAKAKPVLEGLMNLHKEARFTDIAPVLDASNSLYHLASIIVTLDEIKQVQQGQISTVFDKRCKERDFKVAQLLCDIIEGKFEAKVGEFPFTLESSAAIERMGMQVATLSLREWELMNMEGLDASFPKETALVFKQLSNAQKAQLFDSLATRIHDDTAPAPEALNADMVNYLMGYIMKQIDDSSEGKRYKDHEAALVESFRNIATIYRLLSK